MTSVLPSAVQSRLVIVTRTVAALVNVSPHSTKVPLPLSQTVCAGGATATVWVKGVLTPPSSSVTVSVTSNSVSSVMPA
jgi:hypothetical protein